MSSCAAFFFLYLAFPITSNALAGMHLSLLYGAPLLAAGLAALAPLFISGRKFSKNSYIVLFVFSIPLSFVGISLTQNFVDQEAAKRLFQSPTYWLDQVLLKESLKYSWLFVLLVATPFVFYGAYISSLFRSTRKEQIVCVLCVELLGSLLGLWLSIISLDVFSINSAFCILFVILTVLLLCLKRTFFSIFFVAFTLVILVFKVSLFVPERSNNWSARDFEKKRRVLKLDEKWNSFSKVQKLRVFYEENIYADIVSVGDGKSHSYLLTSREGELDLAERFTGNLASIFSKKKALVLFAGAGAEMIKLRSKKPEVSVVGVELNSRVIQLGHKDRPQNLMKIMSSSRAQLIEEDARGFMERAKEKFDTILFSWSGGTILNQSGAVFHSTLYSFTTESIERALSILEGDGALILFGGSKMNLLLSIMKTEKRNLGQSILILEPKSAKMKSWLNGWDDLVLIFKKGTFSREDYLQVEEIANVFNYSIIVSPYGFNSERGEDFRKAIQIRDYELAKKWVQSKTNLYFDAHTDDRPLVYNTEENKNYLSLNFWASEFSGIWLGGIDSSREKLFLISLLLVFVVTAVGVLQLYRVASFNSPVLFFLIFQGLGFVTTSIAVVLAYKLMLYLGHPSRVMLLGQTILFLSSLVGGISFIFLGENYRFRPHRLILFISLGVFIYFLSLNAEGSFFYNNWGVIVLFLLVTPILCLLSFCYAMLLKRISSSPTDSLPYFISVNIVSSAMAAFIVPGVVENYGVSVASWLTIALILMCSVCLPFLKSK